MYSITKIQFSLVFGAWNNKVNNGVISHFISILGSKWNGSIWFCPFTLEPIGAVPIGTVPSADTE